VPTIDRERARSGVRAVARGPGRFSPPDKARFYAIARGSATECGALIDHNIAHAGRHQKLAVLFNNDAILFGMGTVMSLLLCALILATRSEAGVSSARLRYACLGAVGLTLASAIIALPVALLPALNLWGS
jgi:hypothetical protein